MADFIALARAALVRRGGQDTAAVLAAAAFEDALRRLAISKGIAHHRDLSDILEEVKKKSILAADQVDAAESCIVFRGNAMGAKWNEFGFADTVATLAFAEEIMRGLAD